VTNENMGAMTSNIEMLTGFHNTFLAELEVEFLLLPKIFDKYGDMFKMYIPYVSSYEKSISTINALTERNKKFNQVMGRIRKKLRQEGGQNLMSYMIMPVQRVPRYVLLLRELKKNYPEDHPEYPVLLKALTKIEDIAKVINDGKKKNDQIFRVLEISNKLKGYDPVKNLELVSPHRSVLLETQLDIVTSEAKKGTIKTSKRIVYLLTDILVTSNTHHSFDVLIRLSSARVTHEEEKKIIEIVDAKGIIRFFINDDTSRNTFYNKVETQREYCKKEREKKRAMKRRNRHRAGKNIGGEGSTNNSIMESLKDLNAHRTGEAVLENASESKNQNKPKEGKEEPESKVKSNVLEKINEIESKDNKAKKIKEIEVPASPKSERTPRSPKSITMAKKMKRRDKSREKSKVIKSPKEKPVEELTEKDLVDDEDYDIL